MANEITVTSQLRIDNGGLKFFSQPTSFQVDMTGKRGPVPGGIRATRDGVTIDLSELGTPGHCQLVNYDSVNSIRFGRFDPEQNFFYPMCKVGPERSYVIELDADIEEEYSGTGTGTTATVTTFQVRAIVPHIDITVDCAVNAFEA